MPAPDQSCGHMERQPSALPLTFCPQCFQCMQWRQANPWKSKRATSDWLKRWFNLRVSNIKSSFWHRLGLQFQCFVYLLWFLSCYPFVNYLLNMHYMPQLFPSCGDLHSVLVATAGVKGNLEAPLLAKESRDHCHIENSKWYSPRAIFLAISIP